MIKHNQDSYWDNLKRKLKKNKKRDKHKNPLKGE